MAFAAAKNRVAELDAYVDEVARKEEEIRRAEDELPEAGTVEELLGQIAWPPAVVGAAIALERIVVPPSAERDLPKDPDEAARVLAAHPEREDVRLLAACLRDGTATCLLRQRSHDRDDRVARGQDIAPGLLHALRTTLED